MSGHKYISNPTNLFDEDDVDDDTFVSSYRTRNPIHHVNPQSGQITQLEKQRQTMLQRQREIEQRTLESSSRSVGLLRESEQIGIATAEELVRQREQLETTNKRLDEINTNLNYSQKHLNGIKSVFYGFKNYVFGKSDQTPPRSHISTESPVTRNKSHNRLEDTINNTPQRSHEENFDMHPSARLHGLNAQNVEPLTDSKRVEDKLTENLNEMLHSISRLKQVGVALGEEIDQQNELLDNIHDKVETADIKIGRQNRDMNKLLGK